MAHDDEHRRTPALLAGLVAEAMRLDGRNEQARDLLEEWLAVAHLLAGSLLAERTSAWLGMKLCEPVECQTSEAPFPHTGAGVHDGTTTCPCDNCNPY